MTESVLGDNRKIKNAASAEDILRLNQLFADVDLSGVNLFVKDFKRRDEISELQEKTYCIGVIGSGEADVYALSRHEEVCTGSVNVSTQHEGSIFGICNVYCPTPMPTKLICKVKCRVAFMSKADFRKLLGRDERLLERYLTLCNKKIMYLAYKIELMGMSGCSSKLAFYLLHNAVDGRVALDVSKEQFAKFLNVSRASLFRTLTEFQDKKLIEDRGGEILILDMEGLMQCVY
jgi:CRP-like cAMP-binding protein